MVAVDTTPLARPDAVYPDERPRPRSEEFAIMVEIA